MSVYVACSPILPAHIAAHIPAHIAFAAHIFFQLWQCYRNLAFYCISNQWKQLAILARWSVTFVIGTCQSKLKWRVNNGQRITNHQHQLLVVIDGHLLNGNNRHWVQPLWLEIKLAQSFKAEISLGAFGALNCPMLVSPNSDINSNTVFWRNRIHPQIFVQLSIYGFSNSCIHTI
jgi:hypothetical protein